MAKLDRRLDLKRPVTVWRSQDLVEGREASSLTMILRTVGCRWNRCTMCGYASEGAPASAEDLVAQFENAMQRSSPEVTVVKIYTSGSFLDPQEMPVAARDEILQRLEALGIKKLVIETRPQYVTRESVEKCLSHLPTEFAMGLETSNDLIREHVIRKGFTFQDFVDASEAVHRQGGRVKAYLLLKPPLLTEGQAMRDAISSARAGAEVRGRSLPQSLQCAAQYPGRAHVGAGRVSASLALVGPGGSEERAGTDSLRPGGRRHQARPA